jgi:hypothetical protein
MKLNFKELHSDYIRRRIDPEIVQVSLLALLAEQSFLTQYSELMPVTIVTTSGQVLRGEMAVKQGKVEFVTTGSTRHIRNQQVVLVVFKLHGKDRCAQCQVKHVYASKLELSGVDPRYYQRFRFSAAGILTTVPREIMEGLLDGGQVIQRRSRERDRDSKVEYLCRDLITGDGGAISDFGFEQPMAPIRFTDLSLGGCSIFLAKGYFDPEIARQLAYVSFSLQSGRRAARIDAFITTKYLRKRGDGALLHCAFLEPLTDLPQPLVDMSREVRFYLGGMISVSIAGMLIKHGDSARLPLGTHRIRYISDWGDVRYSFVTIGPTTGSVIKIFADRIIQDSA